MSSKKTEHTHGYVDKNSIQVLFYIWKLVECQKTQGTALLNTLRLNHISLKSNLYEINVNFAKPYSYVLVSF